MSDRIQRSVYYYELLAKKHAASGLGEHQGRVYGELAALVGECSTLEEIQQKMRDRGYLEKPAQALYLDKMAAHKKAAETNDFPEIARIYQQKFDEVQADPAAAFVTGWEQEVGLELNRIGNIVDALNEICSAFLRYQGTHPADDEHRKAAARIQEYAGVIEKNGATFDAVAEQPYFRRHSPLDDARHAQTLTGVREILSGDPKAGAAEAQAKINERTQAALKIIEAKTSELKGLGKAFQERSGRSVWLSIAPEHTAGPYAREAFYEED
ncbi:MAG: hypothetical protein NXI24_23140 [bacterium]|nr:hypothetical protein [bacterium]